MQADVPPLPLAVSPRSVCLLVLIAAVIAAPAASAASRSWTGTLPEIFSWTPPDETGTALAEVEGVAYHALSVLVTESGSYTLTSNPAEAEPVPTLIALYTGDFDPEAPLDNLIAFDYSQEGQDPAASLEAYLVEGVVYRVVTSDTVEDPPLHGYQNRLSGPGDVRFSACFPVGDEVTFADVDMDGYAVQRERFCVLADWATDQGTSGTAHRVPFRSDDSVLFWFFAPGNWELQTKVLDGCAVNGHYWVFYAATTDVEFELEVFGRGSNFANPSLQRTYRNEQGHRADAVTDTAAFPCDEVRDQL